MTGGAAVVASLAANGADTVFGIPGTHNLPIYAGLRPHGVRHVLTRHEQGAGFAADGYARVTGRPGVCLTTTGPAVLNAATALAQSWSDSVPVLLVSPGMPVGHPPGGTGFLHEVKDQSAALAAIVGYSHRVTAADEIPAAIAAAFAAMRTGRPRPAHVEIPLDLLDQEADIAVGAPVLVPVASPEPAAVAAAAALLGTADAPVVIAGGGARHAATQVRALAERIGAPVVTTANGKGTIADDHPLAIGAGLHQPAVSALVAAADVVVVVGSELAPSDLWAGPLPFGGPLVRIDIDASAVVTNAAPDVAVIADAALGLDAIRAVLGAATGDVGAAAAARAADSRERFQAEARAEGSPWLPIVDGIAGAVGRDGVLAGDSAMVCYYGALSNLPAYRPASFLYPTGLGTLGYALPAAIGAKVAQPDARVVALHGDGGIMFTLPELAAAAALGLALPVIVVDNGGYGEIRDEVAARGDEIQAVDFPSPDFAAAAVALGCDGVRLGDLDELAPALDKAFGAARPTLLHVQEPRRGGTS